MAGESIEPVLAGRDGSQPRELIPVKVLQLCLAYPPNLEGGGAGRAATELTGQLVGGGHSVLVIAPKLRGAQFRRSLSRTERIAASNFEIVYSGTWMQRGFKTFNPTALRLVFEEVVRSDLVVIHGLRTFIGTVGSLCCLLSGRPYVLLPHGMTVRRWRSLFLKLLYDTMIGNTILRHADLVLCSTEPERQEIIGDIGCAPQRVEVVSVCAWRDTLQPKEGNWTTAKLVFLGRVVPEKGIDLLIEALGTSKVKHQFSVEVFGPIEDEGCAARLRSKGLQRGVSVTFHGPIYGAEKDEMLASSHLLALVSEYESYGLVAQEAVQAGTPVLVTDTCGIAPEISPEVGIVVERSVEHVREQLERLAEFDFRELRRLIVRCSLAGSRRPSKTVLEVIVAKGVTAG
jgi:glycosyltransferase involved in cell wall biosynthesis